MSSSLTFLLVAVAAIMSVADATSLSEKMQSRTTLNLSDLEFTTESVLLGLIILGVLAFDIMFGAVLGNLLFGVRRRDGRPDNAFARRAEDVYNSIDVAESTFNAVRLREEACRHKAVCELEDIARRRPFARIITGIFNLSHGSERYDDAKRYGYAGHNCAQIYSDCPRKIFPSFPSVFK